MLNYFFQLILGKLWCFGTATRLDLVGCDSGCEVDLHLYAHARIAAIFLNQKQIKFPFKRKACQVYEGGCCRQVSTVVSLVVWLTGGCYCKVVAIDRKLQLCL